MRFFSALLASALALFALLSVANAQEEVKPAIRIGLSDDVVNISSNFDGTDLVIFGSIENADKAILQAGRYDVVVILEGPKEEVTVRRREKTFGIWINGSSLRFGDVPSSYSVATTRPLKEIADTSDVKILRIGLNNLNLIADPDSRVIDERETFRASLTRLKEKKKLYLERIGGVRFLSDTLFKARLAVPANVPIGRHTARAFLFQDGKFLNSEFQQLQVRKVGFEQYTYQMAHQNGLLFGIIAVLVAIATGWIASVVFSKD